MQTPGPENSTARPWVLVTLIVVALVVTTVYARESRNGPLHLTRAGLQTVVRPVEIAGTWLTTPVRATSTWLSNLGVSRSEVAELRTQNAELRRRNAELEEARRENERLRGLVQLVETQELQSLGAHVIGRPENSWEGVITIDRGSTDGVKAGMPVMSADGLLGQTVAVTPHSAKVRLITDQRSGVAAMLQQSRAEGVVRGSISRELTMDFVSKDATVTPGEVVLTSGIGGVFPKGLIVGEVSEFSSPANALYPVIKVRPTAKLEGIEEVLVLTGPTPVPEIGSAE